MSYGDGAVMGVPGHDERDFAFAKKYGIDILQVIHVDGEPHFTYDHWQDWYALKDESGERGVTINSDNYSGLSYQVAIDAIADALEHRGPRRQGHDLAPARLGHQPAALLGHADPDRPLRGLRRRAGARSRPAGRAAGRPDPRRLRQSAQQARRLPERRLSVVRQARAPRDRHDGHLRRQLVVLHALLRRPQRESDGRRRQRLLDADGPVHRRHRARDPAPALRALLDQGDARPRAGLDRRAVHPAADAGHGAEPHLLAHHRAGRRRVLLARRRRDRRATAPA